MTGGALQSNHCRQTAAAAAAVRTGMYARAEWRRAYSALGKSVARPIVWRRDRECG